MADKDDSNLRRELGLTRRDLLRRGAVVGGTLLWVAPVIQSITPPAFAQQTSPALVSCCKCVGRLLCASNVTEDDCVRFCGEAKKVSTYAVNAVCQHTPHGFSCVPVND